MADTNFTDLSTSIVASWLNDVNVAVYRAIGSGGNAPTTPSIVRSNIGAAVSGANNDITSLTGLTTALSVSQGGTGAKTASDARTNLAVAGLADANTFSGTGNQFTDPLIVPNASLSTHAIPKGQADGLYASSTYVSQIKSVAASVAANALTLTLNPTALDFRSATLTSGAPSTVTIGAALSLVVPSGATLGTVNGVAARLVMLAIDNGGAAELAVVNLAGGNNLDETTLISTTAISAGATAANVIYSATARSNVPFRVVGFVDANEAVAGTWATTPSLVQGVGGQALAALSSLGYGQTWQNVTGSRSTGTTYYNTTGRPITVYFVINSSTAHHQWTINGQVLQSSAFAAVNTMIIPAGASYSLSTDVAPAYWGELR